MAGNQSSVSQTDYFDSVSKSDMMRVVLALATEIYALRDRQRVLEEILVAGGTDLARLDEPVEAAVYEPTGWLSATLCISQVFAAMAKSGC